MDKSTHCSNIEKEGGEKDESGNDSVLNISLHDDDVDSTTDRQRSCSNQYQRSWIPAQ